jgi:predicted nicotinamide N-methyase
MSRVLSLVLQLAPASAIIEAINRTINNWPSIEAQQQLATVLQCDYLLKFPTPAKSWKHLFKCIEKDVISRRSCIETEEEIFCDELMELIVGSQTAVVEEDDAGYVSFCGINTHVKVPIRVVRSSNQVGTKVWGAGVYLGELCQRVPELLCGQDVIELGAGVGITGLLVGRCLPRSQAPKSFLMTDFHMDIVDIIDHNIAINTETLDILEENITSAGGETTNRNARVSFQDCALTSDILDWAAVTETDFQQYGARVLLAADCTYSEIGNHHLVFAMKTFLRAMAANTNDDDAMKAINKDNCNDSVVVAAKTASESCPLAGIGNEKSLCTSGTIPGSSTGGTSDTGYVHRVIESKAPVILIACTIRSEETYAHFRALIDTDSALHVEEVTQWALSRFPPSTVLAGSSVVGTDASASEGSRSCGFTCQHADTMVPAVVPSASFDATSAVSSYYYPDPITRIKLLCIHTPLFA